MHHNDRVSFGSKLGAILQLRGRLSDWGIYGVSLMKQGITVALYLF